MARQTDLRADQVRVACPEDAEVSKGRTFTCDVTGPDGHTETATVTPTDDDGHFRFEVSSTIHADELEQSLAQQLSKSAGVDPAQVSVACPDGMTASKGKQFDCTLTAPNGDKVKVVVTLTNSRGGFTATVPK